MSQGVARMGWHGCRPAVGWARPTLISMVALLLSGCSTVYLHNAGDKAAIDKAAESLAGAHTEHKAAFDAHREHLTAAVAAERRAIVATSLAHRDQNVVAVLGGKALLSDWIDGRLGNVVGAKALAETESLHSLKPRASHITLLVHDREDSIRHRDREIAKFKEAGGKAPGFCDDTGAGHKAIGSAGVEAAGASRQYYNTLENACRRIAEISAEIRSWQTHSEPFDPNSSRLPPAFVALLAGEADVQTLPAGLQEPFAEAANLKRALKAQQALGKAAAAHLKRLEAYLACIRRESARPGQADRIEKAAKKIQQFVDFVAALDEGSGKALTGGATPEPQEPSEPSPDRCEAPGEQTEPPPAVDTAAKLAAAAKAEAGDQETRRLFTGDGLVSLLVALKDFSPARSLAAELQEEAQEFREGKLNEVLAAIATASGPAGDKSPSDRALVAASIVRVLGHAETLAASDELPSVSAVLVDVAAARLRASNARIEADRLKQLSALADLKLVALRNEVIGLADARRLLKESDPNSGRPLRAYVNSWNVGRLPQEAISAEMRNLDYFTWLERERAALDASYSVLEPAFAELKIYGDGGVKPSDIASYLHTLGLGAWVLGED